MPRIKFPNVPKLPGVPQILRSSKFPTSLPPIAGTALGIARLVQMFITGTGWGIYKKQAAQNAPVKRDSATGGLIIEVLRGSGINGRKPVVVPDNFREFGSRNEWEVADYPVQDGGFASYDKVNNPFEIRLRLAKGGSLKDRTDFLNTIEQVAASLQLYDVVTPEKTYFDVNVTRYEIVRRGAEGAYYFAEVDLFLREIRLVTPAYITSETPDYNTSNAKDPSAVPTQNNGTVQPAAVPGGLDILPQGTAP